MLTRSKVRKAAWDIMGSDEDRYFGGSMAEAADMIIDLVYGIMSQPESMTMVGNRHKGTN